MKLLSRRHDLVCQQVVELAKFRHRRLVSVN